MTAGPRHGRPDEHAVAQDEPRASVHAALDASRREGLIDDDGENALIRQYDERAGDLKEALDRIAPEYQRRVRDDGEASANAWLAETAHAMGRRDGEATRRLLSAVTTR